MDLKELKIKSELSGKKWDAAIKELSQQGLVNISLEGENKIVTLGEFKLEI
jgi:lysyl-tRNA synthetase class 2